MPSEERHQPAQRSATTSVSASQWTNAPGPTSSRGSCGRSAATSLTYRRGAWPERSDCQPRRMVRSSAYLTHPIFHMNRAESEMTRYMRRLADRDLALDRSMIPLGSCTMKLNATAEMLPISWPEFSEIHPFVPPDQALGYKRTYATTFSAEALRDHRLRRDLDAVELRRAGRIRRFARNPRLPPLSRRGARRTVCLIPSSAHGTNPASAQMCGMRRRRCEGADEGGNIDLDDFSRQGRGACGRKPRGLHDHLSVDARRVRDAGARNLRDRPCPAVARSTSTAPTSTRIVGLARPGDIGADVSHLNLHKTFCIPHGGGGPGMGPIGVKAHLIPFLPGRSA